MTAVTTGAGGGDATADVAVTITRLTTDTEVEPGTVASWEVQVRNLRTTSAVYVLDVLGEAADWSRISPRLLDLPGGAEASAIVELQVPRASRPLAGTGHFTVRATSVTPPTGEASATDVLHVAPFADLRASLVPTASAGAAREHVLVLENLGNQPVQATVSAIPSDHRDVIRADASVLRAAPGARARTTIRVCPRRRWRWRAPRRGFTVLLDAGHAETVELQGVITEPSGPPPWAVKLVAVVAVALLSALWRNQVDGWFQSEPSVEQVLDDAGQKTVGADSSRLLVAFEAADPSSGAPAYRLEGVFDYRHHRGSLNVDLAALGTPGAEGTMQVLPAGNALIIEVPPDAGPPAGKPWVRVELADLTDEAALSAVGDSLGLGIWAAVTGLGSAMEVLRGELFSLAMETQETGSEVVRGETTTRYHLQLDHEAMSAQIVPDIGGSFSSATADVWVDERGRLRRVRHEVTAAAPDDGMGSTPQVVVFTMEFFDFGIPVPVEEPPPAETATLAELVASSSR